MVNSCTNVQSHCLKMCKSVSVFVVCTLNIQLWCFLASTQEQIYKRALVFPSALIQDMIDKQHFLPPTKPEFGEYT